MGKLKITIEDLFNINGAVIYNPDAFKPLSSVIIDSRKITKGCLFVAIKGEKYDGHNFVLEAVKKGAKAVMINQSNLKSFGSVKVPVITVKDTVSSYGELARTWRNKLNARVISITGSNGKTTTKEMIATLLYGKYNVVKTEANNNNHIGVPLTIFSADEKCDVMVLEQGTNHFGEIEYSAKISLPDYALITNIGDSHLEFLKNRNGVYKEKSALFNVTEELGGIVLLNMDDPIIKENARHFKNKITFGFNGSVDVKGKIVGYTNDGRPQIKILSKKKDFETTLPVYGEANAKNFLASCAVALSVGLSPKQIKERAAKLVPVHGRLEVKKFQSAIVINDTYNASPTSVESALNVVMKVKIFKKKVVVLGDIFELGNKSVKLHKELAKLFKSDKNMIVLTIGKFMKHLHVELLSKKNKTIHFNTREELSLYLQYEEIDNSVILVKGSRGMKMEEFVNELEKRFV